MQVIFLNIYNGKANWISASYNFFMMAMMYIFLLSDALQIDFYKIHWSAGNEKWP